MMKSLKKVYLPSGLVASLYNVYGGSGVEGDALTMYDIHLLCAFTEFYYNYTDIGKNSYVYWFYSLPQFYKAYLDISRDDFVQKENSTLENNYIKRVFDEFDTDNPRGPLFLAANDLAKIKRVKMDRALARGVPSEIDRSIYSQNDKSIDYRSLATNPLAFAKQVEKEQNFRTDSIYKRERVSRFDPTKKLPVFSQKPYRDASCFFVLNPAKSATMMNSEQFSKANIDMHRRLNNFFKSDSYKAMADQKREDYAPDVKTLLGCFFNAVSTFNRMRFIEDNRAYVSTVKQAENDLIGIEIVSE